MGGLLRTMTDAVHRQMLEGSGAHFRVRGIAVPLDPYLEGTIRTGRKVEFQMPLIVPDNKYTLEEDAVFDTDRVIVDREPAWMNAGGYVTIGGRELHEIEDVSDTTIILATKLLADHETGLAVYHYSEPIFVEGAYAAGQTIINVDVPYFLVRGDVIGITPDATLNISFVEYRITDLKYVGVSGGLHQYQITLDRAIHRALVDDEVIQMRAYPAYVSPVLNVPQPPSVLPVVGPYLVDWLSMPFLNDMDVDEYQTLQRYNDVHLPIGAPELVDKNYQVLHVPIRADQFLWWEKIAGSIKYDGGLNRLVAIPDADERWNLQYTCVPPIEVPFINAKGLIVTVPTAQLANNEGFRMTDDVDSVVFEYQVDGTYTKTAEAAATGTITVNVIPLDNDICTLDDGFGNVITFEFERTAGFTATDPLYRVVDVTTAANTTDAAIELEQAVLAVTALGITADNVGNVVNLTNDVISLLGNTTITESTAGARLAAVGFANGTDRVETIDVSTVTTALETAQLTAAAVNRSGLHIEAAYPTIAHASQLVSTVQGVGGNAAITETVTDTGFVVQGMSGGAGGTAWSFQIEPEQDALLRVRLYPNAWQEYSLTAGTVSVVSVVLDPSDAQVERIELIIRGDAGTEILMGDWTVRGARVSALRHTYVAHVMGERNFASTGLMAKPIFHSKEDLQVKYDSGANFDSGGVML